MSYANATVGPAARLRAASGVIAIHALVGAGVVLGLTVTGVIATDDTSLPTVIYDSPPPPPPPVETVPDEIVTSNSTVTAPKPPIVTPRPNPVYTEPVRPDISDQTVFGPNLGKLDIPLPPVAPATSSIEPFSPIPRNGPTGWITNNDYSRSDLARNREGTAGYRLLIGSNGRVDACEITRSSGHASLDRNTCRLIERRAEFDPATNNRGDTIVGTYSGSVTWQIPD